MATDARISTALPSHPKTKKLVRQLGAEAGWSLVVLILWAASNRSDGDLAGMTDEDIELAADWDGEPGAFIEALRRIRFVDGDEGESIVHDWAEHQPWAAGAEARSLKAKWNAVKRFHGEAEADRQVPEYAAIRQASSKQEAQDQDAVGKDEASQQHASSTAPACSVSSPSPLRLLSESSPTPTLAAKSPAAPKPRRLAAEVKEPAPSTAVWNSYSDAYELRYSSEPVRNAKVNGQLAQLVARLGAQEAPHVAAFYVGHNAQFYVRDMHSVGLLLRDAEKLRTEWSTNRQMTSTKAQQADKTATNYGAFQGLIEAAEARERGDA